MRALSARAAAALAAAAAVALPLPVSRGHHRLLPLGGGGSRSCFPQTRQQLLLRRRRRQQRRQQRPCIFVCSAPAPVEEDGRQGEGESEPHPHAKSGTFGICRLNATYFQQEAAAATTVLESWKEKQEEEQSGDEAGTTIRAEGGDKPGEDFVIINFYHLSDIADPQSWVQQHRDYLAAHALDVKGRIFIHEQGINAQFSAPLSAALQYTRWVESFFPSADGDGGGGGAAAAASSSPPAFSAMVARSDGHAFPRLALRYKRLCQIKGGHEDLPLTDPSQRAVALSPAEWRDAMDESECGRGGCLGKEKTIILDVRNQYEFEVGRFDGARAPDTNSFRDTELAIPEDYDPESTAVLMYCTGGIRCDIFSARLIQDGYKNLYTLEGGIQNYLSQQGSRNWKGHLFVFDNRLAVPGGVDNGSSDDDDQAPAAAASARAAAEIEIGKCTICRSQCPTAPHRNCANLDCNRLFLSCPSCAERLQGCCCESCTTAPRMRPFLKKPQQYGKWSNYRPPAEEASGATAAPVNLTLRAKRERRQRRAKVIDPRTAEQAYDLVDQRRDEILTRMITTAGDGAEVPPPPSPDTVLERLRRRAQRYLSRNKS